MKTRNVPVKERATSTTVTDCRWASAAGGMNASSSGTFPGLFVFFPIMGECFAILPCVRQAHGKPHHTLNEGLRVLIDRKTHERTFTWQLISPLKTFFFPCSRSPATFPHTSSSSFYPCQMGHHRCRTTKLIFSSVLRSSLYTHCG